MQQALGKLNVRMTDLMEQMDMVIKVLWDENMVLRLKLGSLHTQQQKSEVKKLIPTPV
ncbi:MAG: hypothetical protein LBI09_01115 [Nitrososphaerota archaeon]|nr:hypothetical protein [Nitrososphaerota archaeon]